MVAQNYTLDNAAEAILDHAAGIIDSAVAEMIEGDQSFGRYLILKELWDRVTELLALDPDDLRERADELEEEANEEAGA